VPLSGHMGCRWQGCVSPAPLQMLVDGLGLCTWFVEPQPSWLQTSVCGCRAWSHQRLVPVDLVH
jgi:hypothetical protein